MQKLYLDCDGVILDTINYTYQIIKERGIDMIGLRKMLLEEQRRLEEIKLTK